MLQITQNAFHYTLVSYSSPMEILAHFANNKCYTRVGQR